MNLEELTQMSSSYSKLKKSNPKILNLNQTKIIIARSFLKCMVSQLCNKLRKKLLRNCSRTKNMIWTVISNWFKILPLKKLNKVKDHTKSSPLIFKIKANMIKSKRVLNKLMIKSICLIKANSFKNAKMKI
jgi:putative SOS response-associated peptidase YedK